MNKAGALNKDEREMAQAMLRLHGWRSKVQRFALYTGKIVENEVWEKGREDGDTDYVAVSSYRKAFVIEFGHGVEYDVNVVGEQAWSSNSTGTESQKPSDKKRKRG